jgi:hypothetical protein
MSSRREFRAKRQIRENRQPVKTRSEKSIIIPICCRVTASEDKMETFNELFSEKSSAWIRDSAIIPCICELQEFTKSIYQSEPHV